MSSPKYWFIVLLVYEGDVGKIREIDGGDGCDAVGKDLAFGDDSSGSTNIADVDVLIEESGRHSGGLVGASLDSHHEDVAIRKYAESVCGDGEGVLAFVVVRTDRCNCGKSDGVGNHIAATGLTNHEVLRRKDCAADGLQYDGSVGSSDGANDLEGLENDSLCAHLRDIHGSSDGDNAALLLVVQSATCSVELVYVQPHRNFPSIVTLTRDIERVSVIFHGSLFFC